jgi:RNA polymerase sigma-70 factor, ECF subfamily
MVHDSPTAPFPGSVSGSTSSSLLIKVKACQAEAWQRLVQLYGPLVYRWCRQSSLQEEDAADVGQEGFVAVAHGIIDFRRDRPGDSFRGWLWQITRNKIRDHFRRQQGRAVAQGGTEAQQRLDEIPEQASNDSASMSSVDPGLPDLAVKRRAIDLVRASVEPRTWEAFWQVAVNGRSAADVAGELRVGVQAVYDAKYQVRKKIRQELEDLID